MLPKSSFSRCPGGFSMLRHAPTRHYRACSDMTDSLPRLGGPRLKCARTHPNLKNMPAHLEMLDSGIRVPPKGREIRKLVISVSVWYCNKLLVGI